MDRTDTGIVVVAIMLACLGFACTNDAGETSRYANLTASQVSVDSVVVGSGRVVREARNVSPADRVIVRGSLDVVISRSEVRRLTIEADDNVVPLITSTVTGTTLVLDVSGSFSTTNPSTAYLEVPEIHSVSVEGSGAATLVDVTDGTLELSIPGSGSINAAGTTDQLHASVSGAGDIDARRLTTHSASVSISGSGNVAVFADDRLTVNLEGAGNVVVTGEPKERQVKIQGAGDVTFE